MSEKPAKDKENSTSAESPGGKSGSKPADGKGLAEQSTTEHHIPGADGQLSAEAEEDNNP